MKIGIITDCVDDGAAGVGVYTRNLVENLVRIDKRNQYFLVHYKKSNDSFYKGKAQIIVEMKQLPFYREFRKAFLLPGLLDRIGLDVVHEPMQIGPFFLKKGFSSVVTVHDLSPLLFPETFNRIVYLHHKYGMIRILRNVDAVVTDSHNTRKDLLERFSVDPKKIRVIHLGVAERFKPANHLVCERLREKLGLADPFVLYLGTLEPRKNLTSLIDAFHKLKKDIRMNHKLLICGAKGWKYSNIFKRVKQLRLENEVVFTGFIDDEDLPALYSSAKVFVFPSIYEGFGLPPLEAMACGCPVICSNAASLPEVVGDAAITVSPYDANRLSQELYHVLSSKRLRQRLIRKGFKNVKRFSWKRCAEQTLQVYQEVYRK
jgi:glycosyltransferase involved in cell wall biosynthesis